MKKFILKTLLFFLTSTLVLFILLTASSQYISQQNFNNHHTESNTLVFKKNQHYDVMISGISHARNFSRHNNHSRVESILKKSIINIGQGGGMCGVNEQFFYLKYFYNTHNSIDTLVYILSPPMLYSKNLRQAKNTFYLEPFNAQFFFQYLRFNSTNKSQRLHHYIKSKFGPYWLGHKPFSKDRQDSIINTTEVDSVAMKKGFKIAYGQELDSVSFKLSCQTIKQEIQFCKSNNIQLLFVIPPSLFGQWPGHKNTVDFIEKMKSKYSVELFDFSESMKDPKHYYDHHHLNTSGIEYFTKNYLSKSFNN